MSQTIGRRAARRKVTRNGDSLTVLLPRPFQFTLRIRRGDMLELQLFPDQQAFRIRPVRDVPPAEIEAWPSLGDALVLRKLVKWGNGFSVAVPRLFWHTLFAFPGDQLLLTLSEDQASILVRPVNPRKMRPALESSTLSFGEDTK